LSNVELLLQLFACERAGGVQQTAVDPHAVLVQPTDEIAGGHEQHSVENADRVPAHGVCGLPCVAVGSLAAHRQYTESGWPQATAMEIVLDAFEYDERVGPRSLKFRTGKPAV
jgi:hypothetical protein